MIYLLGYSRSGSTLIEDIISKELSVSSLGEVKYFIERGLVWKESCSCGKNVNDCQLWSHVLTEFNRHSPNGRYTLYELQHYANLVEKFESTRWFIKNFLFTKNKQLQEYLDTQMKVNTSIEIALNQSNYIDSSKMPARLFWLDRISPKKPRVIFVVRDPRAVAWSCGRKIKRNEANLSLNRRLEEMPRFGFFSAILRWALNTTISLAVLKLTKSPCITIKYEDFVNDKASAVNAISIFINGDQQQTNSICMNGHSISGNPRRLTGGLKNIKPDEEWKYMLPKWKRVCSYVALFPFMFLFKYKF